jgi:hypothetical protein
MLAIFGGAANAPAKHRGDLLGVTTGNVPDVDGKLTISDTVAVLAAFTGTNYIFDVPVAVPAQSPGGGNTIARK